MVFVVVKELTTLTASTKVCLINTAMPPDDFTLVLVLLTEINCLNPVSARSDDSFSCVSTRHTISDSLTSERNC